MDRKYYYKAKKRVTQKKNFYTNLISWTFVSIGLFTLNMIIDPFFYWSLLPILAWGIGLFFQGFEVFGFGNNWEERKIMEEMIRLEEEEEARKWLQDRRNRRLEEAEQFERNISEGYTEEDIPYEANEELELKEFQKLRKEWDDQEFV